jgi:hypothetical protein
MFHKQKMGSRPIHFPHKSPPGNIDRATKKPIEGLSICHDRGERLPTCATLVGATYAAGARL